MSNDLRVNNKYEEILAKISLTLTTICIIGAFSFFATHIHNAYIEENHKILADNILFTVIMAFMAYGNAQYHICLVGYYKRKQAHNPVSREVLNALYKKDAPTLSILIPSYKEERNIIWQTLVSSALAEYKAKNVVLLIDDPYKAKALEDMLKLEDTRKIPVELQERFNAPLAHFQEEFAAYEARKAAGEAQQSLELNRISMLYDEVADWVDNLGMEFLGDRNFAEISHSEQFFLNRIIHEPAEAHRETANELRTKITEETQVADEFIIQHYARLASLFDVTFTSFERKKYANLSHEANKAMNLNSYIELIGKSWKEVEVGSELHLLESTPEESDFTIAPSDYVNTLDADSQMISDYLIRMIEMMERPENERLAVIQSSVSAFPNATGRLERIAGSAIDVQFRTHQGYTYWNATYWVGANAMLRHTALQDIRETRIEEGHEVALYIQDRTVIEDTESTIDLVEKGWKLYNYPERLSFSAMPPDFGSLLIQRRRWSNGGLIILPKLLKYIAKAPKNIALFKEFFMRFNYLASTTIGTIFGLLMFFYPFGAITSTIWLPLSALPVIVLYARDLRNTGYKYSDFFGVCCLNLMLFPVAIGGVLKQFQQIITGKKIPFGRTPKVTGRTAAPAIYCFIEVAIVFACIYSVAHSIEIGAWNKAMFSSVNAIFISYALVYYMGIKETFYDMFSGVISFWRNNFYHAEIIQIPSMRRRVAAVSAIRVRA